MNAIRPAVPRVLLAFVLVTPVSAHALTVVVPDDFATIQAAISSGADEVLVKENTYTEDLTITDSVMLRGQDPDYGPLAFPTIDGSLTFQLGSTEQSSVVGFRITGQVSIDSHSDLVASVSIRECRLDAGVSAPPIVGSLHLMGCTIHGPASFAPYNVDVTNCTFVETGLNANYEGYGTVRDNVVIGPADAGITLNANDGGASILDNTVRSTTAGIVVLSATGVSVNGNDVATCSGDAFQADGFGDFARNRAADCGGDGFYFSGVSFDILDNIVERSGGVGIHVASGTIFSASGNTIDSAGSYGVLSEGSSYLTVLSGNRILHAGSDGARIANGGQIEDNVVGRSSGNGIVVLDDSDNLALRRNTSYLNDADGLVLGAGVPAGTPIENNIADGNGSFGLAWSGVGAPSLSCNDYFANSSGAVSGATMAGTDLTVDPEFCDPASDDVTLGSSSPLVGTACGQIGAEGVGCPAPVGVPLEDARKIGFTVMPRPASTHVRLSWTPADVPGRVVVFDPRGRRVWEAHVAPGTPSLDWSTTGSTGSPLPAGVYFVRFERGAERAVRRVVLMR